MSRYLKGSKIINWPLKRRVFSILSNQLENIKERTMVGRQVYVQKGGKLGRPEGTSESMKRFMEKPKNKEIFKLLQRGLKYSEIQKVVGCSPKTIKKVKEQMKYEENNI